MKKAKKERAVFRCVFSGAVHALRKKKHITFLFLLLLAFFVGACFLFGTRVKTAQPSVRDAVISYLDCREGEYDPESIVLYDTSHSEAEALALRLGATLRITERGDFATLTLPSGKSIYDVYKDEKNADIIDKISPDFTAELSDCGVFDGANGSSPQELSLPSYPVGDTGYAQQKYLEMLNIKDAWNLTRGEGITVAIIDTGIDTDHSEFAGRISEYSYNATEDKIVKDYTLRDGTYDWSLIEDEFGHGTLVSGVIGAAIDGVGTVGVAPDVELLVIKAECGSGGNFVRSSDLLFGLYYAIDAGADVINMSFGGEENIYADATRLARESGIICVAAAGNKGSSALTYPAADENVIGVGALADGSWTLASYSNYADNTDVVAPGYVYTTKVGGTYTYTNGTSLACPSVSAAAALYLSVSQNAGFPTVRESIYASAKDIGDPGPDRLFGYGALDINALVCEERCRVSFDMQTSLLADIEITAVKNHTLKSTPTPVRDYAVFDAWYYDAECTLKFNPLTDKITADLTLYAGWLSEDSDGVYTYFELDDGTVEICSYRGQGRYVNVPEKIDGKTVSTIGRAAFSYNDRLIEVSLPNSVKVIGDEAFYACSSLCAVNMPSALESVGERAFSLNTSLTSVSFTLSPKLKKIGESAFADCAALAEVSFGKNTALSEIQSFAFSRCTALRSFYIPSSLSSLDGTAFYASTGIEEYGIIGNSKTFSVSDGILMNYARNKIVAYPPARAEKYKIPISVSTIGTAAFAFSKIPEINLNAVTTIGVYAFRGSELEKINITDIVNSLGAFAFDSASKLEYVKIGQNISEIPQNAFSATPALRSLEIPANIKTIGKSAFSESGLEELEFAAESSLSEIGSSAFYGSELKTLLLPRALLKIGNSAFARTELSSLSFEEGSLINSIGARAFENTAALSEISLPFGLVQIGESAFSGSGLAEIHIPSSLTGLGAAAFSSCKSLENIFADPENPLFCDIDGVLYTKDLAVLVAYPAGSGRSSYSVNGKTVKIADYAFFGANKLEGVVLPDGLSSVGRYALADLSSLKKIEIPASVCRISTYAFAFDTRLESLTFAEGSKLSYIAYGAFAYTGLRELRVPASVSFIGEGAFYECRELLTAVFAKGSALSSLSAYTFSGCDKLGTLTFEEGAAISELQPYSLEGLKSLRTVDFGDAEISSIGSFAFLGCESLKSIKVPESVTYIGKAAFSSAKKTDVYFLSQNLPLDLQDGWDDGIRSYYLGVRGVFENDFWRYAELEGGIVLTEYKANARSVDLSALDFGTAVIAVGAYAFYEKSLDSVILPESLLEIQAYAFAFSGLESIDIPEGTKIDSRAFYGTHAGEAYGLHSPADAEICAPTCQASGVYKISCLTCGAVLDSETIPARGHDLLEYGAKLPDCTNTGHDAFSMCTRCDFSTYIALPPLGHDEEVYAAREPSCTDIAWDEYVSCKRCSYTTYTEIPPLGHKAGGAVIQSLEKPDCLNTGMGISLVHCDNCGHLLEEETFEIPALGHSLVFYEKKEAACTDIGWEAYTECVRCSYTDYKEIPARGHVFSKEWSYDRLEHWHECQCSKRENVSLHGYFDFGEWQLSSDGKTKTKSAVCFCGKKISVSVPRGFSDSAELLSEAMKYGTQLTVKIEEDEGKIGAAEKEQIRLTVPDKKTEFFEITIFDTVEDGEVLSTAAVSEYVISRDLDDKAQLSVLQYYNGTVREFKMLNAAPVSNFEDGTCYIDTRSGEVYIYTKSPSAFALSYIEAPQSMCEMPMTCGSDYPEIIPSIAAGASLIACAGLVVLVFKKLKKRK